MSLLSKDEIRAIDKNSGLSKRQFANQVGVSRQMIEYFE